MKRIEAPKRRLGSIRRQSDRATSFLEEDRLFRFYYTRGLPGMTTFSTSNVTAAETEVACEAPWTKLKVPKARPTAARQKDQIAMERGPLARKTEKIRARAVSIFSRAIPEISSPGTASPESEKRRAPEKA